MINTLENEIRLPIIKYKWNKYNKNIYDIEYLSRVNNRRIDILRDYFIELLSKRYKYVYYLETSLIYYLSKNELKIEPIYLHMELLDIFITLPNKFKSIYVIVSGNKINIDNYVLDKRDYIMNETIESLIYKGYSIKPSIVMKLDYMVSDIKDIDEKYIKLLIIKNKLQNYYKYYLTNNRILNNRYYVNLIDCLIKKIEDIDDIEEENIVIDDINKEEGVEDNINKKKEIVNDISKSDIKLLGTIGIMMGIKSFLLLYDIIMGKK